MDVHTIFRRTLTRAGLLAAAVTAAGIAVPLFAQEPSPSLLPPKPLPAPNYMNWPETGSGATTLPPTGLTAETGPALTPSDGPVSETAAPPIAPPSAAPMKIWTITPTSQPTGTPIAPPRPITNATGQSPVWMVRPQGQPLIPMNPSHAWRGYNQSPLPGREGPAAMLAVPRGAVTPTARPDWNWHGYDTYNQAGHAAPALASPATALAADMAPYLKYAHLWRLSQNAIVSPTASTATAPPAAAPSPALASGSGPANPSPASIEWRGIGDNQNQAAAGSAASAWNTNGVTTANYANALPARPVQAIVVADPPPGTPGARIPITVRSRISEVCQDKTRNLVVEQLSPIRLRIAFMVREQTDAESLTAQLAALPELGPYKVDFEVQIGQ